MTPDTGMPAEQGSERDLVGRLRRGDEDAFERLVREHGGRLLAVARRFLEARDAVQECSLSAFLLTCRDVIAVLADLSSGELAPVQMRESRRHLAACRSCAAYRRSYRATVRLAREAFRSPEDAGKAEMPEAMIGRVLAAALCQLSVGRSRARHVVHLLSGIAAGPLLAFCLR